MAREKFRKVMLFRFCAYGFLKNLRFFKPYLYLFFLAKGLSFTQIGALISVQTVTIYLWEIPTGVIADLTGRRRAMALAFASYLLSFAVFTFTGSFWAFAAGMFLFGIGEAFRSGTHKSMIMQHLDLEGLGHRKVHYYGTTRSISRLGSALAVLLAGGIVYLSGGYRYIWLATAVPYVAGLALMLTYPPELDGELEPRASLRGMFAHMRESFASLFRVRELGKVIVNASVFDSFFRVSKDYLQPILQQAAVAIPALAVLGAARGARTAALITPVYFLIHINAYFSSRYSGSLVERVGRLPLALNGLYWLLAAGLLLAGIFQMGGLIPLAVLMIFTYYTLYNLRGPMVVGFLSDRIEAQQRATVLSVHAQARAIVQAAVAPLLGYVADTFTIPYMFVFGGLAMAVAGILLRLRGEPAAGQTSGPAGPNDR